jgi:transcriptional regulator with GAF, ATPase, and Fis domain
MTRRGHRYAPGVGGDDAGDASGILSGAMGASDDDGTTVTIRRPSGHVRHRGRLTILNGPDAGKRVDFDSRVRIGSRGLADVILADSRVSGLHCEIIAGDNLRVRDLGSKNGTFVGRLQIVEAVVAAGETLTLGDTRLQVTPLEDVVEAVRPAREDFFGLIGPSPPMQRLIGRLEVVAATDSTVLLQGETGTGKERVAEAIHLASKRANGPLVTVDCGAMPATLIDSELFGYERGAYTGADRSFTGAFERARGGTIFLDEIGELPLELQPKLLRVLESRQVRRLGGQRVTPIDARIIAATNRDLALEVNAGRFREDLYFRLAVVTIMVPPLRERLEDLPLLVEHLLQKMGVDPTPFLAPDELKKLASHPWPGNVRELRNLLERAASLAEPLSFDPPAAGSAPPPASGGAAALPEIDVSVPFTVGRQQLINEYERRYMTKLLAECGGSISEVARRSGLERTSIYRILRRIGVSP